MQRAAEQDQGRNVRQRTDHNALPVALRQNSRATVQLDHEYANGRLANVILRPIRQAGRNHQNIDIFRHFADRLRTEIYADLRPTGISDATIRNRVRVSVFMNNWNNPGNNARRQNILVRDLNNTLFMDMFEDALANGSNPDLDIYDVIWKVWINPASVQGGGSKDKEEKHMGLYSFDWDLKTYKGVDKESIGCAAKVLGLGLEKKEKTLGKDFTRRPVLTKKLYDLQQELGFFDALDVTVCEMENFVKIKPNYRLVVVVSLELRATIYTGTIKLKVGSEYIFNKTHKEDKSIFVFHDIKRKHFRLMNSPLEWTKAYSKSWCFECCTAYNDDSGGSCYCGAKVGVKRIHKSVVCEFCNVSFQKYQKHSCGERKCMYCQMYYKEGFVGLHRCPLYIDPTKTCKVFIGDENEYLMEELAEFQASKKQLKNDDKNQYELWVWDIESHFVSTKIEMDRYVIDENGVFVLNNGELTVTKVNKCAHLGNYVCCKNVFTGKEAIFESLEEFITFATFTNNNGYNYFIAHNSSGYDSRLLMEISAKVMKEPPQPLWKNSRIMRMSLSKCIFQDSMFHLMDSLKSLGKGFGLEAEKGYFPHLFSTLANLDYIGPIPDKDYFDLTFSCKTQQDFDDFNTWHDGWKGDWNYRQQRKLYCQNDVVMLAQIVKIYHDGMVASLSPYPYLTMSPWFSPTMAGYVHKLMIRHLHEGEYVKEKTPEELREYAQTTWCALEPEEHYYAKKALRGGMTNICKYLYDGDIKYQDIQSAYPSVQLDVDNLYPVGSPIIEVYDKEYYPCVFCSSKDKCTHTYETRVEKLAEHRNRKIQVIEPQMGDINGFIELFFGILTVDITPPRDLYHPLVQGYDKIKKKVIGSLDSIVQETLPCVIVKEAIKIGYVVTKIYRADRYKSAESKFRNGLLGDMYVAKMKNAGKISSKDQERMKKTFMDKYKIDLGDMDKYEKNPVLKKVAKGPITAAWGKHAESVDHPKSIMFNRNDDSAQDFHKELLTNERDLTNVRMVGEKVMFNYTENRAKQRPELHRGYLPVAIYVTAYGRLKLWRQLVKIDPRGTKASKLRVLMYDTDSIVYEKREGYFIPEGDCLGDWETEDVEKDHQGIIGFRAIAPKSYAIVCRDGYSKMHLKGATIKHAHSQMLNPEMLKKMLLSKKPGTKPFSIKMPQMSFDYEVGKQEQAMTTRYFTKEIQFIEENVKGVFSWKDYRGYPQGYSLMP